MHAMFTGFMKQVKMLWELITCCASLIPLSWQFHQIAHSPNLPECLRVWLRSVDAKSPILKSNLVSLCLLNHLCLALSDQPPPPLNDLSESYILIQIAFAPLTTELRLVLFQNPKIIAQSGLYGSMTSIWWSSIRSLHKIWYQLLWSHVVQTFYQVLLFWEFCTEANSFESPLSFNLTADISKAGSVLPNSNNKLFFGRKKWQICVLAFARIICFKNPNIETELCSPAFCVSFTFEVDIWT